jgi:hypothetical protein
MMASTGQSLDYLIHASHEHMVMTSVYISGAFTDSCVTSVHCEQELTSMSLEQMIVHNRTLRHPGHFCATNNCVDKREIEANKSTAFSFFT